MIPKWIKETIEDRLARVRANWPDAEWQDICWLEPVGSRQDAAIFNRKTGRVLTGYINSHACFEGDLDAFAEKIEKDYSGRLLKMRSPQDIAVVVRYWDDYRAVVVAFRALY